MKVIWFFLVLLFFCIFWLFFVEEDDLVLVADGSVPVYASRHDATSSGGDVLVVLSLHQRVKVISSIDVKHYLIYEVDVGEGKIGFVNDGDYRVVRGEGLK